MQEIIGDIFDYVDDNPLNGICIFTNGILDKQGLAVAGAGQAKVASKRWSNFKKELGRLIKENGNNVGVIGRIYVNQLETYTDYGSLLISFPTKEHFKEPSIPLLINKSARQLVEIADSFSLEKIVLGRPGCGQYTGKLDWDKDVKPLIENILDDRFIIITKR